MPRRCHVCKVTNQGECAYAHINCQPVQTWFHIYDVCFPQCECTCGPLVDDSGETVIHKWYICGTSPQHEWAYGSLIEEPFQSSTVWIVRIVGPVRVTGHMSDKLATHCKPRNHTSLHCGYVGDSSSYQYDNTVLHTCHTYAVPHCEFSDGFVNNCYVQTVLDKRLRAPQTSHLYGVSVLWMYWWLRSDSMHTSSLVSHL